MPHPGPETVILSRIYALTQEYDQVVVDMPASGHALSICVFRILRPHYWLVVQFENVRNRSLNCWDARRQHFVL